MVGVGVFIIISPSPFLLMLLSLLLMPVAFLCLYVNDSNVVTKILPD